MKRKNEGKENSDARYEIRALKRGEFGLDKCTDCAKISIRTIRISRTARGTKGKCKMSEVENPWNILLDGTN